MHPARQPWIARRWRERRGSNLSGGVFRARRAHAAARHGGGRREGGEARARRASARLSAAALDRARDLRLLAQAGGRVTAPAYAEPTSAAYFSSTPPRTRFGGLGLRRLSSAALTSNSSRPRVASMRTRSPFFSSAIGPPAAASGET